MFITNNVLMYYSSDKEWCIWRRKFRMNMKISFVFLQIWCQYNVNTYQHLLWLSLLPTNRVLFSLHWDVLNFYEERIISTNCLLYQVMIQNSTRYDILKIRSQISTVFDTVNFIVLPLDFHIPLAVNIYTKDIYFGRWL